MESRALNKARVIKVRVDNRCCRVISHKPNADGYIRVYREGRLVMLHRWVYQIHHGGIPVGHEIDHVCRVRDCINIDHLESLPASEHTIKGNMLRYKGRNDMAYEYWVAFRCTGTALGKQFGVSYSTGCRWIQNWRELNKEEAVKVT